MVIISGRAAQRFIVRWVTFCKPKRNIAEIAMQNDYKSLSITITMYLFVKVSLVTDFVSVSVAFLKWQLQQTAEQL